MHEIESLIGEMEAYCEARGWSPSTFGTNAVGDGKFYSRLKAGRRCWPETVEKARKFIRENPAPQENAA